MSDDFQTRYTHGGDEWILVELAEAMSLGVNMRAQAICRALEAKHLDGVRCADLSAEQNVLDEIVTTGWHRTTEGQAI